jgi:predicted glycoside hydrolase/deacetylase ChbG (UPF0249 family)
VVVHVDDLGMCADANAGGLRALAGAATSGSVMVPCPGFAALAAQVRGRPELDLGVHLTLNCEYSGYRWGPLRSDVPSLCAPDAGLLHSSEETVARADPDEVRAELAAQIERALDAGIDVTHLDAHMGTALRPQLIGVYLELAERYALPAFLPRVDPAVLSALGLAAAWPVYRDALARAQAAGLLLFDHFQTDSLSFEPGSGLAHNRRRVASLGAGLSYLITHCAHGGEELARISPDWRQRAEEGVIYSDGSMARCFAEQGVQPLGMRPLFDALRRGRAVAVSSA